jgi:uncharacterized membrane protein
LTCLGDIEDSSMRPALLVSIFKLQSLCDKSSVNFKSTYVLAATLSFLRSIFLTTFLIVLANCSPPSHRPADLVPGPSLQEVLSTQPLGYKSVSSLVLSKRCDVCHGSQDQIPLNSQALVSANLALVKKRVFQDVVKPMPPVRKGPLTACESEVLAKWLELGAPMTTDLSLKNISSCAALLPETAPPPIVVPPIETPPVVAPPVVAPPEVPPVDPGTVPPPKTGTAVTFKTVFAMIDARCTRCHIFGGSAEEVPLDGFSEIIRYGRVVAGNSGASKIYQALVSINPKEKMPPPRATQLTPDEINLLRDWIDQGALNN